jgi:hypothetical protein
VIGGSACSRQEVRKGLHRRRPFFLAGLVFPESLFSDWKEKTTPPQTRMHKGQNAIYCMHEQYAIPVLLEELKSFKTVNVACSPGNFH